MALGLIFHGDKRTLELKSLIPMPPAHPPHSRRLEEPLPSLLDTLSGLLQVTSLPISSFHQSPVPFIFLKTPSSLAEHSLEPSS